MAKQLAKTTVAELLATVTFPEFVPLPDGTEIRLADVARRIAEDDHPGDDAVEPQFLLKSALAGVKLGRLTKAATEHPSVTGEVARECCALYDDELQLLANMALSDVAEDASQPFGCGSGTAALILVCGVLMHEARRTGAGELRLMPGAKERRDG